jgi:hypothetical protein
MGIESWRFVYRAICQRLRYGRQATDADCDFPCIDVKAGPNQ